MYQLTIILSITNLIDSKHIYKVQQKATNDKTIVSKCTAYKQSNYRWRATNPACSFNLRQGQQVTHVLHDNSQSAKTLKAQYLKNMIRVLRCTLFIITNDHKQVKHKRWKHFLSSNLRSMPTCLSHRYVLDRQEHAVLALCPLLFGSNHRE